MVGCIRNGILLLLLGGMVIGCGGQPSFNQQTLNTPTAASATATPVTRSAGLLTVTVHVWQLVLQEQPAQEGCIALSVQAGTLSLKWPDTMKVYEDGTCKKPYDAWEPKNSNWYRIVYGMPVPSDQVLSVSFVGRDTGTTASTALHAQQVPVVYTQLSVLNDPGVCLPGKNVDGVMEFVVPTGYSLFLTSDCTGNSFSGIQKEDGEHVVFAEPLEAGPISVMAVSNGQQM